MDQPQEESVLSLTMMDDPWLKSQHLFLRDEHSIWIVYSTISRKFLTMIMEHETIKVIRQLLGCKALGEGGISPEVSKHGGDVLVAALPAFQTSMA